MTPQQLVTALATRLIQAGIPVDPIDPDVAETAAARLMEALDIPVDLDLPLRDSTAETHAASAAARHMPARSHSPTALIGHAHQVLTAAGLQPRWPAITGHADAAVRAADRLQLALGVPPRIELADVVDRVWDEHDR